MDERSRQFFCKRRRSPFRHGFFDALSTRGWKLPKEWLWNSGTIIEYITWFAQSYDLPIKQQVKHAWHQFAIQVNNHVTPAMRSRELRLISWKRDHVDEIKSRFRFLDLGKFEALTTFNKQYDVRPLSGFDFCVLAVLVIQEVTVDVLLAAIDMVERNDLRDLALCCDGATHRSVGCMILLAAMVYPNAEIVLTTKRTQQDAINYGLWGELPTPGYIQQQLVGRTCDVTLHTSDPQNLVKLTRKDVAELLACLKDAYESHKTLLEVLKGVTESAEQDSNMIFSCY